MRRFLGDIEALRGLLEAGRTADALVYLRGMEAAVTEHATAARAPEEHTDFAVNDQLSESAGPSSDRS